MGKLKKFFLDNVLAYNVLLFMVFGSLFLSFIFAKVDFKLGFISLSISFFITIWGAIIFNYRTLRNEQEINLLFNAPSQIKNTQPFGQLIVISFILTIILTVLLGVFILG